ncbi:unnamed protein product [Didymodactylos carnosus]|uniref:Phosphodiesterase n=1 Tax=Didymodactylos carnosus TaxID=1234261 RepID=A0A813SUS7_9BILA|nr:unnamed protein product [Didymodactylos carnosus]CAF3587917.1 unnamed protein product [Didymodactylos carnosus]
MLSIVAGSSKPPSRYRRSAQNYDELENFTSPFTIKSKPVRSTVVERDVSGLTKIDDLPPPESFDALQCGGERIRTIIAALQHNVLVRKEDLMRNLDYVARVLESAHLDETRRLMEEDDVLSEIEPDSVPNEVRDWLAMTFTRSMSTMKRRPEEKPKFKSVAQAIRAGIMVDRILKKWSLRVKVKVSLTSLQNFLEQMEMGYSKYHNPYHNLIHAADVLQTTYQINWLTDHELFAMFVAAIIHDFEHTGTTNSFHVQSKSDVALIYNDRAVLENHHVSAAFRLMRIDDYNIVSEFSNEEYRDFRQLVIDMVLATDMSFHFTQLKNMKGLLSMPENIEKSKALALVLHCADISHPGKPWHIHHSWTENLLEEYFKQGEKEKELGLPCSPLCDRENTLVAESQIGFIQYIVEPSFSVMGDMLEKIIKSCDITSAPASPVPLKSPSPLPSPSPPSSAGSSNESGNVNEDTNGQVQRPLTTPTPTTYQTGHLPLRRPWEDNLRLNKERWQTSAEEEKRRRELKSIPE